MKTNKYLIIRSTCQLLVKNELLQDDLFLSLTRNLLTPWGFPSWRPVPRVPPTWSKPSWPWRLRSRRGWAPEPQPAPQRSPTSRSRASQWTPRPEAAAETWKEPRPESTRAHDQSQCNQAPQGKRERKRRMRKTLSGTVCNCVCSYNTRIPPYPFKVSNRTVSPSYLQNTLGLSLFLLKQNTSVLENNMYPIFNSV